jgi:hypothetical protein
MHFIEHLWASRGRGNSVHADSRYDRATLYKRDATVAHVLECLLEFTIGGSDVAAARCGGLCVCD